MKILLLIASLIASFIVNAESPFIAHVERLIVRDSLGTVVVDNPYFFGSMGIPGEIVGVGIYRLARGDQIVLTVSKENAKFFAAGENQFVWKDDPTCTSVPLVRNTGFSTVPLPGLSGLLPIFLTHFDGNFYDINQSTETQGGTFHNLALQGCRFLAQSPDLVVRTLTFIEADPAYTPPFSVRLEIEEVVAPP